MKTTIADRCRMARKKTGRSQKALADAMASASQSMIERYETGETPPPVRYLAELAILTGVDPGWLLSGTDSPAHAKLEAIRQIVTAEPLVVEDATAWVVGTVFPNTPEEPKPMRRKKKPG